MDKNEILENLRIARDDLNNMIRDIETGKGPIEDVGMIANFLTTLEDPIIECEDWS